MNWADYFYYDETSPSCLRWAVDVMAGRNRKKFVTNTSTVTGVILEKSSDGNIRWRAKWRDESGKYCSKSYSVRIYGPSAFNLAVAAREAAIQGLEGYTERHGK